MFNLLSPQVLKGLVEKYFTDAFGDAAQTTSLLN